MFIDKLIIFVLGVVVGGGLATAAILGFMHVVFKAADEDDELNERR
jgi:hypothetical protein